MCGSSFEASRLLYQNKSCHSYYWRQEPGTCKSKIIAKDQDTLIEQSTPLM